MTIKFEVIDQKTLSPEGDSDLLSTIVSLRDADVNIQELVRIDMVTAMRLDLFCKAYYGEQTNLELFLMINGIVNPFEEPLERVLIMPDMGSLKASLKRIDLNSISNRNTRVQAENTGSQSSGRMSTVTSRRGTTPGARSVGFKKLANGNIIV